MIRSRRDNIIKIIILNRVIFKKSYFKIILFQRQFALYVNITEMREKFEEIRPLLSREELMEKRVDSMIKEEDERISITSYKNYEAVIDLFF